MKQFVLENTGAKSVRFTGERLGGAASTPDTAHPDYSGEPGRWQEYDLYRTEKGKYVCHKIFGTCWQGESAIYEVKIVDDVDGVIKFFGQDSFAHELYENCGIENFEDVE